MKTRLDGQLLRSSWACFADAFKVEASELGLITRKFSLVSFLHFLTHGDTPDCLEGAFEGGQLSHTPEPETYAT